MRPTPRFRGTSTGAALQRLACRHGVALEWHQGFTITASEVPAQLRGPAVVTFACDVERRFCRAGERIDAAVLGRAAAALPPDPGTLQLLKQLWHVLVAKGDPAPG